MSYSVIRCPNCGSLDVTKRSDGSYFCSACTATFRMENEENTKKYKTLNGMKKNFNYYVLPSIYNKDQFLRNILKKLINNNSISYRVLEGEISEIQDNKSHFMIVDIDADASITCTVGINKDVPYTDYEYVNNNGNKIKVPVTKMKKVMEYSPYSATIFTSGEGINLIDGYSTYDDYDFKHNLIYSFYNDSNINPSMAFKVDISDELIEKSYEDARNIIYENLLPKCDDIRDIKHYIKPTSYCGYLIEMNGYEFNIKNNDKTYKIYGSSYFPSFTSDIEFEKTDIPTREFFEEEIKNKYKGKIRATKIMTIVGFAILFTTTFILPFLVGQLEENTMFMAIPLFLFALLIPFGAVSNKVLKTKQEKEIHTKVDTTRSQLYADNYYKKIELANKILTKLNQDIITEDELNKEDEII